MGRSTTPPRPGEETAPATSAGWRPDGPAATLVLVRHGRTAMTDAGAYSGAADPGPDLTTAGHIEAARAADAVARLGRDFLPDLPRAGTVVASPLARTQQTAEAIGRRLGAHVRTDPDLVEAGFGSWDGLTAVEIDAHDPGGLRGSYAGDRPAPGGESVADVGARVAPVLGRWAVPDATVVLVTHTIVIRAAVGLALDAPVHAWNRVRIAPGSLTVLRRWPGGPSEVVATSLLPR